MNRFMLTIIGLTVLVGCLKTRAELEAEETGHVAEKVTVAQQQTTRRETVVKEKAPPSAYRFEEIDEQLRALNGRVDTLENVTSQLNALKANEKDGVSKEKREMDQKFVAYEEELKKMEAQIQALNEEVTRLKAPPPPPPEPAKSAKSVYDSAEEHFAAKKWKEAITNFQKYREQNPKGKQFADATYKIGVCFQELGMKDEAKAFFEEVTAKHPGTKEAKKAALRMKSIK
jgi:TolA-binding protein